MRFCPPTRARARSSAVEHYLDTVGVTGSIPVAPTTLASQKPDIRQHFPGCLIFIEQDMAGAPRLIARSAI